jgi:hypothetical protein
LSIFSGETLVEDQGIGPPASFSPYKMEGGHLPIVI